ncbi:MAG: choice-of-anchor J domain-containing protein [Bacteroidota bacterium]
MSFLPTPVLRFLGLASLLVVLSGGIPDSLSAQSMSRSGMAAPLEDKASFRKFPCGGDPIFDQRFNGFSIPSGWTTLDEDGLSPNDNIDFLVSNGGWQSVVDFKDSTGQNRLLASPSWYDNDAGPSDDWLISPQIVNLPANVCLSWYAYSQDAEFGEKYEVLISTTGNSPAAFLANDPLLEVEEESSLFTYRNLDLSDYAGQDIYVAFHHISDNQFILALDDIRIAEVKEVDMAMFLIDPIVSPSNEEVTLSGAVINRGLTDIDLDSVELAISYSIDGGDAEENVFLLSSLLEVNDTLTFEHDSTWTPTDDAVYRIKFWIEAIPGDDNQANDTLAVWQGIGTLTSNEGETSLLSAQVFPNPSSGVIHLHLPAPPLDNQLRVIDEMGREVRQLLLPFSANDGYQLSIQELPPGRYVLLWQTEQGAWQSLRVVRAAN